MQAQEFYDVEIRVQRTYLEGYGVSLRAWYGDEIGAELAPLPQELISSDMDPGRYGVLMFNWLLKGKLVDAFWRARKAAGVLPGASFLTAEGGMRLRLWLGGVPPQLARLRWEALQAPDDYLPLSLSTAFSRYVRVKARPPVPLLERPLRMLHIFASPADLGAYGLPQLDPALAQLADRLGSGTMGSLLVVDRIEEPVTLDAIQRGLKRGYHMVYAVVQTQVDDGLYVMLADESGNARRVSGDELGEVLMSGGALPPQLAILATPLTRPEETGSMQEALTGRLLESGVQSVLVSEIPQESQMLQRFSESFFRALMQTGVIDVAVAQARAEIYDTQGWDWCFPVLVSRGRDSQLFQPLSLSVQQQIAVVEQGATVIGAMIEDLG